MYKCRNCGHEHTDADWLASPITEAGLRACHACGSLAVHGAAPPLPESPYGVHRLDDAEAALEANRWPPPPPPTELPTFDTETERRDPDQDTAIVEAFIAGTLPDEGRRDDDPDDGPDAVEVPDDIQVDDTGVEVRRATKRPKRKK